MPQHKIPFKNEIPVVNKSGGELKSWISVNALPDDADKPSSIVQVTTIAFYGSPPAEDSDAILRDREESRAVLISGCEILAATSASRRCQNEPCFWMREADFYEGEREAREVGMYCEPNTLKFSGLVDSDRPSMAIIGPEKDTGAWRLAVTDNRVEIAVGHIYGPEAESFARQILRLYTGKTFGSCYGNCPISRDEGLKPIDAELTT